MTKFTGTIEVKYGDSVTGKFRIRNAFLLPDVIEHGDLIQIKGIGLLQVISEESTVSTKSNTQYLHTHIIATIK